MAKRFAFFFFLFFGLSHQLHGALPCFDTFGHKVVPKSVTYFLEKVEAAARKDQKPEWVDIVAEQKRRASW